MPRIDQTQNPFRFSVCEQIERGERKRFFPERETKPLRRCNADPDARKRSRSRYACDKVGVLRRQTCFAQDTVYGVHKTHARHALDCTPRFFFFVYRRDARRAAAMGLCGISTFIMGALTGGFFGDFIPQLLKIIDPSSTFALPALFNPLDDALSVLVGSLAIGLVQIFTGMIVSMYKQIKRGETMAAICNEGAWFAVFILAGAAVLTGQTMPCVIAILVLLVLTQGYGKEGIIGKIMGIFGSLYNNITGYFSDIMSYSRLMALMLAGAVVAQVFNQLGAITGNVIFFVIIAAVGNALNFALNLLGCFVHDMRLQCLEFFGRFYEDGGKPFRPLNITTKFVDIEK